jgi:hypothetical protein
MGVAEDFLMGLNPTAYAQYDKEQRAKKEEELLAAARAKIAAAQSGSTSADRGWDSVAVAPEPVAPIGGNRPLPAPRIGMGGRTMAGLQLPTSSVPLSEQATADEWEQRKAAFAAANPVPGPDRIVPDTTSAYDKAQSVFPAGSAEAETEPATAFLEGAKKQTLTSALGQFAEKSRSGAYVNNDTELVADITNAFANSGQAEKAMEFLSEIVKESKARTTNTQQAGIAEKATAANQEYDAEQKRLDREAAQQRAETMASGALQRTQITTEAQKENAKLGAQNNVAAEEKTTIAADALDKIKSLRESRGFKGSVGAKGASSMFGLMKEPIPGTAEAGFNAQFESLRSILTLTNLGKLKGALSDKDMEVLRSAATALNTKMPEKDFNSELAKIEQKMHAVLAAAPQLPVGGSGGGMVEQKTTDDILNDILGL